MLRIAKCIALLTSVTVFLLLAQGWDARDIDEVAIYSSEGYDVEDGAVRVHVTGVSAVFMRDGGANALLISTDGQTMGDALDARSRGLPDELLYGALQSVLFGRAAAEAGIGEYADANVRSAQTNLNAYAAVAEPDCAAVYRQKAGSADDVGVLLAQLLRGADLNSFMPTMTVSELALTLRARDRGDAMLPILVPAEDGVRFDGVACFRGDRMVGDLRGREAAAAVMLRGQRCTGAYPYEVTYSDGEQDHGTVVLSNRRTVSVAREGDRPVFTITVQLRGDLAEHSSPRPSTEDPSRRAQLEQAIRSDVERVCLRVLRTVTEEMRCDCLDLTRFAKPLWRCDPPEDLRALLENARIRLRVQVSLSGSGETD